MKRRLPCHNSSSSDGDVGDDDERKFKKRKKTTVATTTVTTTTITTTTTTTPTVPIPLAYPLDYFRTGVWVFLMVNLAPNATKATMIKYHQIPELVLLNQNTGKQRNQHLWTILMRVGPFAKWSSATDFADCWNLKSRGTISRIAKGISLAKKYNKTESVGLWITSQEKRERIHHVNEFTPWFDNRKEEKEKEKEKLSKTMGNHIHGDVDKTRSKCICGAPIKTSSPRPQLLLQQQQQLEHFYKRRKPLIKMPNPVMPLLSSSSTSGVKNNNRVCDNDPIN